MINQTTGFSRRVVRTLSTKIQKTPEQIKEGLERVEKHKKFVQPSGKN